MKLKIVENSSFEILETKPLNDSEDITSSIELVPTVPKCCETNPCLPVDLPQNEDKKDPVNLEEFEKRQNLIKEQNRLKKEMLGKALALRYI